MDARGFLFADATRAQPRRLLELNDDRYDR
jgi:hypothetical protein